ncbi:hypothetical protein ACVWZX_004348 [Deinococcus sp. UYEF24]
MVETGLDLTEAYQTRLLKEDERRFQILFEPPGDGVVLTDPHDPVVPWRIVDCNEAFGSPSIFCVRTNSWPRRPPGVWSGFASRARGPVGRGKSF